MPPVRSIPTNALHPCADDSWRIPDVLWERIVPLLPPRTPHPLGCHRPRVDDRRAMDAIFFVLRTGCQWNALNATGLCSSSSAHRRFQEWVEADVFVALWEKGLVAYDALQGIDWEWLAMDGAMTKAPLGGEKGGQESHGPRENGDQTQHTHRGAGRPHRLGRGRRESQ
jgi:transposase